MREPSYRLQENVFGKARGRNPRRRTSQYAAQGIPTDNTAKIFLLKPIIWNRPHSGNYKAEALKDILVSIFPSDLLIVPVACGHYHITLQDFFRFHEVS